MTREAAMPVEELVEELAPQRRFEPYPEYRDSGVEWLGELPKHWQTDRLKWTVSMCRNGIWGDESDSLNDIACVRVADFDRTRFLVQLDEPTIRAVAPSQRAGRVLRKGDLLLEKSGGGELQPVGAVMLFDHDREAVCSNFVARMPVATGFDGRFLAYFHAHLYDGRVNTRSIKQTTGIQNLDSDSYLNELIPFVPVLEQKAIAAFLNREMARIDQLIAKKQRLIELLAEKRTALISHAVTKGLNPDAPMKDSGIEWLGSLPSHWTVKKLKFLAEGGLGNGLFKKKQFFGSGVRLVNVFDVYRDDFLVAETTLERVEADATEVRKYAVIPGDVFFVRSSLKLEGVGKSACMFEITEPTVFECHLVRMRPNLDTTLPLFLINYLNSIPATNRLIALANQVTMTTIDQDKFKSLEIPVPPLLEQEAIVAMLIEHTRRFFALTSSVREAIDKLREYRSALISAAVTGKIDVRNG